MDINVKVKDNLRIPAFYVFFIIVGIQSGVGIIGTPRIIFTEARQDSWISIIIATAYVMVVLLVMLIILRKYENADILGIQIDIFGKWIGKLLGTIYIVFFACSLFSILITYIEIVRVFVFPNISSWMLGLILLLLVIYSVLGGIRVIVGVCFLFFFFSHWLLILLIQPLGMMDFNHFQPAFQTPVMDLLKGAQTTSYTFIGFEILFMVYPFIKNKKKAFKPVLLGATWTGFLVLLTTVISIGFFSHGQLLRREWAVLTLFKIQSFSFIERFDYVVVAEWMMIIMPNLILLTWAVTHGMKRLYKIPQKISLYGASLLFFIGCIFIDDHFQIQKVIDRVGQVGIWIVYVYPFILLPLVLLKKRRRKGAQGNVS